jgi:hypothetical protein
MQKLRLTAIALAIVGLAGDASAQVIHSQAVDIVADTTWGDNEDEVVLQAPIFVKSGATLTILPGTIIRGQPRTAAVAPGVTAGTPGALIVTQAGKINAAGSPDRPIIWTTAAVDNITNGTGLPPRDGVPDDVDLPLGFEDAWVPGDAFLDNKPGCPLFAPETQVCNAGDGPLAPLNTAGDQTSGLWGGLVILGRAPTNLANGCPQGWGRCTVEGLTIPGFSATDATYGGVESHDNSGVLQFNSVRHGGDEIGNNNELNGITLAGVGDGTIFEFNEVYVNFDDGIEWFGGTVSGNNLVVNFVGDDAFDQDQGYTGVNQFLFAVANFYEETDTGDIGTDNGDKICELDGDDFNEVGANVNLAGPESIVAPPNRAPWPLSHSIVQNLTAIGSSPDSGPAGSATDFATNLPAAATNLGCQMRNGFGGELRNSIVVNTCDGTLLGCPHGGVAGTGRLGFDISGGGATGYSTVDNVNADYDGDAEGDIIRLYCTTVNDGAAFGADETNASGNGNILATTAADNNVINSAGFPDLIEEDATFTPTGTLAGKLDTTLLGGNGVMNPRPGAGITGVGGCAGPTEPGTDGGAVYRGAFIRTDPEIWTTPWTVLNISGLMAD